MGLGEDRPASGAAGAPLRQIWTDYACAALDAGTLDSEEER
jgi:hypothetical protein